MSKIIQNIRNFLKSTKTASVVPIITDSPSKFTGNQENNIINPGEFFYNQEDNKLWLGRQDAAGNKSTELIYPAPVGTVNASGVTYDNSTSGLVSTDVQDAIDEVAVIPQIYGANTTQSFLKSNFVQMITVTVVANSLRGYFITIEDDLTIKDLRIRMSTGAAGASIYGIYDINASGYPVNRLYATTAFDNSLTSQQVFTQNLNISKGTYFVAYNSNSTPIAHAFTSGSLYNPAGGTQTTISSSAQNAGLGVAYSYVGSLPATFPAGAVGLGNVNHPAVIFLI